MKDADEINGILADESIFPFIIDDLTPRDIQYRLGSILLANPAFYVLHPNRFSVFFCQPINSITYESHANILPPGRGKMGIEAGKQVIEWMFNNTPCQKMISWVPTWATSAHLFARACGFKIEGLCRKSLLKDGVLHDQTLFGLEKVKWGQH